MDPDRPHPTAVSSDGPLTTGECLALLRSVPIGRLVYTENALPAVRPVTFAAPDGDIVIPTDRNPWFHTASTVRSSGSKPGPSTHSPAPGGPSLWSADPGSSSVSTPFLDSTIPPAPPGIMFPATATSLSMSGASPVTAPPCSARTVTAGNPGSGTTPAEYFGRGPSQVAQSWQNFIPPFVAARRER
ncbi:hypothetical protein R1CP_37005 (plasmid) [Rhodococcus opacus]|uniref:Uncharacterized protein n=1 Tax=Rhodococcus opacus TaxID=37919 RepID=A0A1B1KHC2_RHOOP|nr:hypothetical protein R1CP_37005 [Rhodococcus opacus]